MKNITTEIVIAASPERIWEVLLDFAKYPEWNPFIEIEGKPVEGTRLRNTMTLEGRSPQVFQPEVLVVDAPKELRWLGKLLVSGLFDGEHYFLLEPVDEQHTRLVHGENFRGLLVGILMKMIGETTRNAFERMNVALKRRVEEGL